MFKRALVSVSDKTGLVEFLRPLAERGLEIVSTGGTAQFLKENKFKVIDISQLTNFPEVLDGRVKTLHPYVHMSLLARQDIATHREVLEKFNLQAFDLLVCNLYPFEEAARSGAVGMDLIEKIDVGGPTMLRAAAKNFASITVLCDPQDYSLVLQSENTIELRKQLAAKVFALTSYYDSLIFNKMVSPEETSKLQIPFATMAYADHQHLRYGENSHQRANWKKNNISSVGLHQAKILQGKELSFNNLLDLEACLRLNILLDMPACVIVKHNNPCGVAQASRLAEAVEKAYQADSLSAFGGIISVNRELDKESALILSSFFTECILAPSFSSEALELLSKKKNLRLLEFPQMANREQILKYYQTHVERRSILGGVVEQDNDMLTTAPENYKVVSGEIAKETREDLILAEKIVSSLKSNAICLVSQGQSVGLGMGQVNRVDAVEQALTRWQKFHPQIKNPVLASDAFFPFADSIELLAQAGVRTILQPGGSVKDEEVIATAQKHKLNMIFTQTRHFRH